MVDLDTKNNIKTILDCFYFRTRPVLTLNELQRTYKQLFPKNNFDLCLEQAYKFYCIRQTINNDVIYITLDKISISVIF